VRCMGCVVELDDGSVEWIDAWGPWLKKASPVCCDLVYLLRMPALQVDQLL